MPKSAFFNVSQSLDAIDKWRDEMEDTGDDATVLSIGELQQGCLSPRSTGTSSASSLNASGAGNQQQHSPVNRKQRRAQQQGLTFGPGSSERDQHIVQLLREKHDQLKTRDGFRGYFRGIEEARLERILREVFTDPDRVRRRMQLMSGLFRHELQR
ncbi:hypothetical protein BBJ28_00017332 [Nothophytophthora sp. Chile5]|nr:hypothetical protein BBJ28_00017332 [Nothophytophthora sp. Chile5]